MSPLGRGIRYRIKTFASGKRVRLAFLDGEVVETKALPRRKRTKTRRSLTRRRRRIGYR